MSARMPWAVSARSMPTCAAPRLPPPHRMNAVVIGRFPTLPRPGLPSYPYVPVSPAAYRAPGATRIPPPGCFSRNPHGMKRDGAFPLEILFIPPEATVERQESPMAYADQISPILRATFELLREAGRPLPPGEVRKEVEERVPIAPELRAPNAHGQARWWAQLGFRTGEAASLGWMTKRNGWAITEAGVRALQDFPGTEFYRELARQYRARRLPPQSRVYRDPRWNVVLEALKRLEPGAWTTYGDLAALVGMSAQAVGGFMAESADTDNAHRVLQSGGRISPQFRWSDPERTDDPRQVLEEEGLAFDQAGRADPGRRVTADRFRTILAHAGVVLPRSDAPLPVPPPDPTPAAFEQFQQNLEYARQLVDGGRNLERLAVGSFDVTDLYRAAWSQAVAALDHWVTREIVDRAVTLALTPRVPRPPKFNSLSIPVELFEKVHHHDEPLGEMFRAHLERHFAFMTFQNPEKIKEGFAHVSPVNLWVRVAEVLTDQDSRNPITADGVRTRLREIAWRRNNIAHTADHDPDRPGQKTPITADEAEATIEWLETMAIAIQLALGDPLPEASPNTGEIRATPSTAAAGQADGPRRKRIWDEPSSLQAVEHYCPADVRATLLAVYRHAESHPSFHEYYFGEGEYPSVTAWFNLGSDKASVWNVYTGPAKSVLAVNFGSLRHHGASRERMARLAERLGILPGSARLRDQLESADYGKYPSLQPVALAHPEAPGDHHRGPERVPGRRNPPLTLAADEPGFSPPHGKLFARPATDVTTGAALQRHQGSVPALPPPYTMRQAVPDDAGTVLALPNASAAWRRGGDRGDGGPGAGCGVDRVNPGIDGGALR
ncbi:hypothetical protein FXF59_34085, partial [Microbispora tritici]